MNVWVHITHVICCADHQATQGRHVRALDTLVSFMDTSSPQRFVRNVPNLWTGFGATLVRDVPFSALYWAMVEPLRQAMLPKCGHMQLPASSSHAAYPASGRSSSTSSTQSQPSGADRTAAAGSSSTQGAVGVSTTSSHSSVGNAEQDCPPFHHTRSEILLANMVSGGVAGGAAAAITTPFDVVKTRFQVSARTGGQRPSIWGTLREVYAKEGVDGLFKGVKPRASRAAPACAIVISCYELLKSVLTQAR